MPVLKRYDAGSASWKRVSGGTDIIQQTTAPSSPVTGDLWLDTDAVPSSTYAWQAWTPTLTNLTLGNGTVLARYIQIGKVVHFRFVFTLGTTSAVGTDPNFTLPVAASADHVADEPIGRGLLDDTGVAGRPAHVWWLSGDKGRIIYLAPGASIVTSTSPHTWGSTDKILLSGTYEAA